MGRGGGAGATLNVPWIQAGLGDADYAAAFELVVLPVLREFGADLVLISAGFDAARGDPQGRMALTPAGYAHMTRELLALPDAAVAAVLEGGYDLDATAACAEAVLRAMVDDADAKGGGGVDGGGAAEGGGGQGCVPCEGGGGVSGPLERQPSAGLGNYTESTLREVITIQRAHWACLRGAHEYAVEAYFGGGAGERGSANGIDSQNRSKTPPGPQSRLQLNVPASAPLRLGKSKTCSSLRLNRPARRHAARCGNRSPLSASQ